MWYLCRYIKLLSKICSVSILLLSQVIDMGFSTEKVHSDKKPNMSVVVDSKYLPKHYQTFNIQTRIATIVIICYTLAFCTFLSPNQLLGNLKNALTSRTLEQQAVDILGKTPLIGTILHVLKTHWLTLLDGHNDLAILIKAVYKGHIYSDLFTKLFEKGGMPLHVDLPRLKEGKSGGAFWSAYVPCPSNWSDFSKDNYAQCKLRFELSYWRLPRSTPCKYKNHICHNPWTLHFQGWLLYTLNKSATWSFSAFLSLDGFVLMLKRP